MICPNCKNEDPQGRYGTGKEMCPKCGYPIKPIPMLTIQKLFKIGHCVPPARKKIPLPLFKDLTETGLTWETFAFLAVAANWMTGISYSAIPAPAI